MQAHIHAPQASGWGTVMISVLSTSFKTIDAVNAAFRCCQDYSASAALTQNGWKCSTELMEYVIFIVAYVVGCRMQTVVPMTWGLFLQTVFQKTKDNFCQLIRLQHKNMFPLVFVSYFYNHVI